MGFGQGLSGLAASSKLLDTIGNNVANANTVGFKASDATFVDMYANSLAGGGTATGIGTRVSSVSQQFSQGNITASANSLDLATNGSGFFRMSHSGSISYTRNGQFQLDKSGFLVDANGDHLTGYQANAAGQLSTGAPVDLVIGASDIPSAMTTNVSAQVNLDSRAAIPAASPFNAANPASYNSTSSITTYDGLGNAHTLQTYYVKTASGTWNVYGTYNDGTNTVATVPAVIGTLGFGPAGAINVPAPPLPATYSTTLTPTTGAAPYPVRIDWTGSTQFGSGFSVNALSQDGYASGRLTGFTTASDGIISASYSNGQTKTLGQVVLANFSNPDGLQPVGNNNWVASDASGAPLVGAPGSGNLGGLQASATEESNVDLATELVNMIAAQRDYQANIQTVKRQDQVMQTLMNLP